MALTPMMQQYQDVKQSHPDALLFFRLGDFYEMFFDDAVMASRLLDITLTGRDAGEAGRAPMCGVPFHAAEGYIAKLVENGYKVAICEQVEDPKATKGLVAREVIRVVTPGTLLADDGSDHRFLAAVAKGTLGYALAFVDVNTGDVFVFDADDEGELLSRLRKSPPRELLLPAKWADSLFAVTDFCKTHQISSTLMSAILSQVDARAILREVYSGQHGGKDGQDVTSQPYDATSLADTNVALAMAVTYIRDTQRQAATHLLPPKKWSDDEVLTLDESALASLEVLETVRGRSRRGSLLHFLNRTVTALGGRTLRHWVERPLHDLSDIAARQDAIHALVSKLTIRDTFREALQGVYDLERLLSRLTFGSAGPRDLLAISKTLHVVPVLKECLVEAQESWFTKTLHRMPDMSTLANTIHVQLVDNPPVLARDGGVIREGFDEALDELRRVSTSGKEWLAQLEQKERDRTGIRNLKVGYNKVFGYYLEVSKASVGSVPDDYERRQTLTSGERFVIPALKARESEILQAAQHALDREVELFAALCESVRNRQRELQSIAVAIGELDALVALSVISSLPNYVRPRMQLEPRIKIEGGRHPVVETAHPGKFVANDISLDNRENLVLITGPNMGGKSTFMRQTAIIVILAHLGCFVPASRATIGLCDRVFTRIGASDDLSGGQSTFMVEMTELAEILRAASPRSLILLDEIGRGTSTYDGLSIAQAVAKALQEPDKRPLTLFATHYHELTTFVETLSGARNCSVAVEEVGLDIVFLHRVVNRPADRSYGIHVARLAGIPEHIIQLAQGYLQVREQEPLVGLVDLPHEALLAAKRAAESGQNEAAASISREVAQSTLFVTPMAELVERLKMIDVNHLTPLAALNLLFSLHEDAKGLEAWAKFR